MRGSIEGRRSRRRRRTVLDFEVFEVRSLLSVLLVTAADVDGGPGTLRQAIEDANASHAPATIDFSLINPAPYQGLPTIFLATPLPPITVPVTINGTSNPGSAMVAIVCDETVKGFDGLTLNGGNSTIEGLELTEFTGAGIVINGVGGNRIVGNQLISNFVDGILINGSSSNTIGGLTAEQGNNFQGNFDGIRISGGSANNLILGNTIQNNVGNGIEVSDDPTDPFGFGIPSNNTIGGSAAGARNLISRNTGDGVLIGFPSENNHVVGNLIGADLTGTVADGNVANGVEILDATGNTIGGLSGAEANVIGVTQ